MELRIEIDEELLARIDHTVGIQKISRDVAFKRALERWIMGQPTVPHGEFLNYPPDPDWMWEGIDEPGT